jgi:hypothetical protein
MADGSLKLRDHPGDMARVASEKCRRAGQYRKGNLVALILSRINQDMLYERSRGHLAWAKSSV